MLRTVDGPGGGSALWNCRGRCRSLLGHGGRKFTMAGAIDERQGEFLADFGGRTHLPCQRGREDLRDKTQSRITGADSGNSARRRNFRYTRCLPRSHPGARRQLRKSNPQRDLVFNWFLECLYQESRPDVILLLDVILLIGRAGRGVISHCYTFYSVQHIKHFPLDLGRSLNPF